MPKYDKRSSIFGKPSVGTTSVGLFGSDLSGAKRRVEIHVKGTDVKFVEAIPQRVESQPTTIGWLLQKLFLRYHNHNPNAQEKDFRLLTSSGAEFDHRDAVFDVVRDGDELVLEVGESSSTHVEVEKSKKNSTSEKKPTQDEILRNAMKQAQKMMARSGIPMPLGLCDDEESEEELAFDLFDEDMDGDDWQANEKESAEAEPKKESEKKESTEAEPEPKKEGSSKRDFKSVGNDIYKIELEVEKDANGKIVSEDIVVNFKQRYTQMTDWLGQLLNNDSMYENNARVLLEEFLPYIESMKQARNYKKQLKPLLDTLDERKGEYSDKADHLLEKGQTSYDSLWLLFKSGKKIIVRDGDMTHGGKIVSSGYKSSFFFKYFEVRYNVIQSNGKDFYSLQKSADIVAFKGIKDLQDLHVQVLEMDSDDYKMLTERGAKFREWGRKSEEEKAPYLAYHGTIQRVNWWRTTYYKADGRVMIDPQMMRHMDPNYREYCYDNNGRNTIKDLGEESFYMTWPTIGGFSFACKKWGEILVANASPIVFDDTAFDTLVLPDRKKYLIRSLVEGNNNTSFSDIISNKGGGCIFLLHGPPGVGKTLTAESIAELKKIPLYSVSVGELGTDTDELETRLRDILDVAASWGAVILIDEADIFLEKRTEKEIERNAMVGIFLRLLEYHNGILFLTTNRVQCFDPAFKSRISVALRYPELSITSRLKIWQNLLKVADLEKIDPRPLARHEINGRQIRTYIRLAKCLAEREGREVTVGHLDEVISITGEFTMNEDEFTSEMDETTSGDE